MTFVRTLSVWASFAAGVLLLVGCGAMQSMMTASVDDTAKAKVLGVTGDHEAHRLGADGNSAPLEVAAEVDLVTADMVIGSDDEASALLLALDNDNFARFNAADFVLRSPIGEDNKVFSLVLEYGAVELNVVNGSGRSFQVRDTNKNEVFVQDTNARFVVLADDDGTTIFVKEGEVQVSNTRTEFTGALSAGNGLVFDPKGVSSPLAADDTWLASYQWAADPAVSVEPPAAEPVLEPAAEPNAETPGGTVAPAPQAEATPAAPASTDTALPEK